MNPAALVSKQRNMVGILKHIINCGEASRPTLAAVLKVSTATVTNIVNELLSAGLVYEGRSENSALGRKAKLIRFNAKQRYLLVGTILDERRMRLYLCDLLGYVMERREVGIDFRVDDIHREEEVVAQIRNAFLHFRNSLPAEVCDKLAAVGLSVPGLVNYDAVVNALFFNWKNMPLKKALQAVLGLPVYMDNVTRMKSIYEMRSIRQDEKNVIYLALSPGIGMVSFFEGRMVRGSNGIDGEVGHMSLDIHGEPCYCGNRGCFELYCGELYLVRKGMELLERGECKILEALVRESGRPMDLRTMVEARDMGSLKLYKIFREAARYLGSGLTNLINCFDPDRIIISGTLVEVDSDTLQMASEYARESIVNKFSRNPAISVAGLRDDEIQKAICAYVLEKLLPEWTRGLIE